MNVLNTQMHVVTFIFTAFELAILFFAVIWYLSRPKDKARKRYVILLSFLIWYNILSALFPDEGFTLPIKVQMIFAYLGGFSVSMYFVYYIYKTLELERLRTIAIYGSIWCLFLPFILLFVVPYTITGNFDLSRRLTVAIPIGFSFFYIYTLTKAIWPKLMATKHKVEREGIMGLYISVLLWAMLPFIVFFDIDELVEHCITNTGFMIMSVVYVRAAIFHSRKDHENLLESKESLKRANETLQLKVEDRTRELKIANEKRVNSFINLMHETKTPLTLINNCLDELLLKYGESEEMDITRLSLSKLNRNMNNFFDMHKLERGIHIYDHSKAVDFGELINQSITMFKPWALNREIKIFHEVTADVYLNADPEALYRIVENLLENAIKYSNSGGIINIQLTKAKDEVYLLVKDTGPGISAENHEKIFEPYCQVDHKKKNVQGIGMGLSLVKRTIESLKGKIYLTSEVGKGSEFKVTFPHVDQSAIERIDLKSNDINGSSLKPKVFPAKDLIFSENRYNIMIIEDQLELLHRISHQLSSDYNIFISTNGVEALQKLDQITTIPDLIITDVMMDEMDGFTFVQTIRNKQEYQHIPIIFITAISEENEKLKGLRLGAVDFLVKPFSIDELRIKINSILQIQEQQKVALIENASKNLRKNTNGHSQSFDNTFLNKCKEYRLSEREVDIIQCRIAKMSYNEMADKLCISEKTVSNHLSRISEKVGTIDRMELMEKLS